MKRFIEGENRTQSTLFPERLDDYIGQENPVRVVEAFVEHLDLGVLGFEGVVPAMTGRPSYHPAVLLKHSEGLFENRDACLPKSAIDWCA